MQNKIGRNDPCPCGSGKKYKQCCIKSSGGRKKIKATVISSGSSALKDRGPDLLERTFGEAIRSARAEVEPPAIKEPSDTPKVEDVDQ